VDFDDRFVLVRRLHHGPGTAANHRQMLAHHGPPRGAHVRPIAGAQLTQVVLGSHAAVEAQQASAGAEAAFPGRNHGQKRCGIAAVAGQCFPTEREAVAVDDQADAQLLTVGAMIARVAALGLGMVFQTALAVGAGQVVEQQVVVQSKQIAGLLGQVFFDGGLVGFDQAETAIQMVERQPRRGDSRADRARRCGAASDRCRVRCVARPGG
jgi:hypothetical protein